MKVHGRLDNYEVQGWKKIVAPFIFAYRHFKALQEGKNLNGSEKAAHIALMIFEAIPFLNIIPALIDTALGRRNLGVVLEPYEDTTIPSGDLAPPSSYETGTQDTRPSTAVTTHETARDILQVRDDQETAAAADDAAAPTTESEAAPSTDQAEHVEVEAEHVEVEEGTELP